MLARLDNATVWRGHMSTVFISYRREIAAGEARALFNDLAERIGDNSVFMDVDSIALGVTSAVYCRKYWHLVTSCWC